MRPVHWVAASCVAAATLSIPSAAFARDLAGTVRLGDKPVSNAKVTLWRTAGTAAPA